jgi:hypothetical protein
MKRLTTALLLSLGIISGLTTTVKAENAATAPAELKAIVSGLEKAANSKDLNGVMEYYSPEFSNADGLTPSSLAEALTQVWKSYPQLKYVTEIESWSQDGNELVAETITTIKGVQNTPGRVVHLNSILRSRQYFQDQKLVRQDMLSEQTKLTSGDHPPDVKVSAPETVQVGQKYNFDVIVNEPLDNKVLLGAVTEDKTASSLYLNPTALELEPLPAGGIYKVATAPLLPDSNWLSAILVRGDGITMVTQRVNVEEKNSD